MIKQKNKRSWVITRCDDEKLVAIATVRHAALVLIAKESGGLFRVTPWMASNDKTCYQITDTKNEIVVSPSQAQSELRALSDNKFKLYGQRYHRKLKDDPKRFEQRSARRKQWWRKNSKRLNGKTVEQRKNRRQAVFAHYGVQCACCREKHQSFLAIDHIDGIKTEGSPRAGPSLYSWLIRNGYPAGYRSLCHNCNTTKGLFGFCPHMNLPEDLGSVVRQTPKAISRRKLKQQVMDHYGGCCACCGETALQFLSIDHIDNDGAQHRRTLLKEFSKSGSDFYLWVRKNKPTNLRCLCHNCNLSRGLYGVCPHQSEDHT